MKGKASFRDTRSLRGKVAYEAAALIYTLQELEYRQAKARAAKDLGTRVLPTNGEVAWELDAIADEREGPSRLERLVRMRREALEIMEALKLFHPRLVGSVWRGTAHRNSDIDVTVFSSDPNQIVESLREERFKIEKTTFVSTVKKGETKISFHITVSFPSGDDAEIVVRNPEKETQEARCEIYGDIITGLNLEYLRKVLRVNPVQRFVPKRGY
ncbi:MAG: nucleotidyltransferase domain-containing protein [Candidatus Bathyarchaeota archaeon]|nr:nucleotidyltransferase domain-containing protein [Candidatus Bathyarchaeota archaeon]